MSIELVGLAYDRKLTDTIWWNVPVREAYAIILEDDFRRKVDLRSLLYHKGHLELLASLESFIKEGGEDLSIVELIARRFAAGVEMFPSSTGELAFDFQLIRHFSSLAMVDDFLVADPFLRELLRKVGFLKNGAGWSLLEVRDFEGIATALRDVRMQDILEAGKKVSAEGFGLTVENLVRNYIEFLNYSRNNGLTPFFYNSESDFRRWGDLAERKNDRNELIVDLSMRGSKRRTNKSSPRRVRRTETGDVRERMRLRRERDGLVLGLRDPDPLIRQKVAESLGRLADEETLPSLIQALSDAEPEVRQEIVHAIGKVADKRGVEALLGVLAHDDVPSVRLTAAYVLQSTGVKEVIPLLLDEVEKGSPRYPVLLAFHPRFSADRVAHSRVKTMAFHENAAVRREVAFLLGRVPVKVGQESLVALLADDDEETRCNALYSLWHSGWKGVRSKAEEMAAHRSPATANAGAIVAEWAEGKSR